MHIEWRKSSFSTENDSNCLELASTHGTVLMRESDTPSTVLTTSPEQLRGLLASLKRAYGG